MTAQGKWSGFCRETSPWETGQASIKAPTGRLYVFGKSLNHKRCCHIAITGKGPANSDKAALSGLFPFWEPYPQATFRG
jgi:hypothetical protein